MPTTLELLSPQEPRRLFHDHRHMDVPVPEWSIYHPRSSRCIRSVVPHRFEIVEENRAQFPASPFATVGPSVAQMFVRFASARHPPTRDDDEGASIIIFNTRGKK